MVEHIAFIMDGNRRYGEKQQLNLQDAYKKGMEKFLYFVSLQVKYSIKETSFFALSSDNLDKRKPEEMNILFELIKFFSENQEIEKFFKENKIKIELKGDIDELEKKEKKILKRDKKTINDLKQKFEDWNKDSSKNPKFKVNIALNYDGQKEILHSFKEILKKINNKELKESSITTKTIKENLWFNSSNPPEIIVRPGNAPRISGFMLYDSEYSEIYLTNKLWPELNEVDFIKIIDWYKNLKRNFGQ